MGLVMRVESMDTVMLNDVFGDIGLLNCEPVKIELNTDFEPYSLTTPHCITFPLLPKVEAELKRVVEMGTIEKVTEPTSWLEPKCCQPSTPPVGLVDPLGWSQLKADNLYNPNGKILLQTSAFRYSLAPETGKSSIIAVTLPCCFQTFNPRDANAFSQESKTGWRNGLKNTS